MYNRRVAPKHVKIDVVKVTSFHLLLKLLRYNIEKISAFYYYMINKIHFLKIRKSCFNSISKVDLRCIPLFCFMSFYAPAIAEGVLSFTIVATYILEMSTST